MKSNFQGKRILLFAPSFFGYEKLICSEFEEKGAVVHLYDERNNPSSIEKVMYRKAKFLMNDKINAFYHKVCTTECSFNPDYILFINPEAINRDSILELKKTFITSKFIIYMWDSCENKKVKEYFQYFDKCLSFDRNDCEKYNLEFRPLFYNKKFEGTHDEGAYKYAVSFIGTVHSDRAKILSRIKKECDAKNLPYYFYLYVPGKLMYFMRTILDKSFRSWEKEYIHTIPLNNSVAAEVLARSRYIVDINHPKQTGLTMRTIEMIGLRRKIITTNKDVCNYDFYNPINQIIIDRENVEIPLDVIDKVYQEIDNQVYEKYSISTWVEEILA